MGTRRSLDQYRIDYDALARKCGEDAYRRAKQNGLSDEDAEAFREIFGTPTPKKDRLSPTAIKKLRMQVV
jgi:hypothetical protein